MYYIRIPAHEIEKNEYVFINGHNQFDTNKWRLQETLRKRMSMYVIQEDMRFEVQSFRFFAKFQ